MDSVLSDLVDLARDRPARTAVHTVVPLAVASVQGANALAYDLSPAVAAACAFVLVCFAVGATRHSLAVFRTESLEADLFD